MNLNHRIFNLAAIALLAGGTTHAKHFEYKERHLGPTGLFGVTSPEDITITTVIPGSPADGKIKVGDVIVAAGGLPFKDNTRTQLASAIVQAETEEAKGILTMTLKDDTKVDLPLKVLGTYSATAPLNCPKTDTIITQTAEAICKSKEFSSSGLPIDLLGLLATGEQDYIDFVKKELHAAPWAKPDLELSLSESSAWAWGYTNLLLAEYFLLTKDEYVLPALKTYSVALAEGRDAAGLWGHRMANPENNRGQLHGRLPGYAVMNQSSLACFISLLLADKCGIKHPEVQTGIEQTHQFYTGYIGRGTLPYGVHNPNVKSFNNNGMSGLAAVAFALHGNKEGAVFFSKMSAASTQIMENGHTGHYFNQLWTGLGAAMAGPEVSAAFFKETIWLHTLNRTWDGNFTFDGSEGEGGQYSYRGLSDAGSHLLNYSLARRKLFITGMDADPSIWLKGNDAKDAIAVATLDVKSKNDDELLGLFGHAMPKLRGEALGELRSRPHKLLDSIKTMLRESTALQRQSAIEYFGSGCPPEQIAQVRDELISILRDPKEDMAVRANVASSLCFLGEAAYPFFNDFLELVMMPKPDDKLGRIDEQLGTSINTLCPNPYAAGLVKDKKLFYAVAHKLMDHKRATGRFTGTNMVAHLPIEDFHNVADKVQYIIADKDLTYHSYHNLSAKTACITILANLNIKGGIEACFAAFEDPNGKVGFKMRMLMDIIPKYGANAQYALPQIKATNAGKFQDRWLVMTKEIESATPDTRKMLTIEEAVRYGKDK